MKTFCHAKRELRERCCCHSQVGHIGPPRAPWDRGARNLRLRIHRRLDHSTYSLREIRSFRSFPSPLLKENKEDRGSQPATEDSSSASGLLPTTQPARLQPPTRLTPNSQNEYVATLTVTDKVHLLPTTQSARLRLQTRLTPNLKPQTSNPVLKP